MKKTQSRYRGITHVLDIRLNRIEVNEQFQTTEYKVKGGEHLTDLAWRKLGDAQYYWVLADINNILNPMAQLEPGRILLIPSRESFTEVLNADSIRRRNFNQSTTG